MNAARIKRLNYYTGKTVLLDIGDEHYMWTGEAFYGSSDLTPVNVEDKQASIFIDGNERNVSFVYVLPGEDDTVYYEIYGGATGDYLIMEKLYAD